MGWDKESTLDEVRIVVVAELANSCAASSCSRSVLLRTAGGFVLLHCASCALPQASQSRSAGPSRQLSSDLALEPSADACWWAPLFSCLAVHEQWLTSTFIWHRHTTLFGHQERARLPEQQLLLLSKACLRSVAHRTSFCTSCPRVRRCMHTGLQGRRASQLQGRCRHSLVRVMHAVASPLLLHQSSTNRALSRIYHGRFAETAFLACACIASLCPRAAAA